MLDVLVVSTTFTEHLFFMKKGSFVRSMSTTTNDKICIVAPFVFSHQVGRGSEELSRSSFLLYSYIARLRNSVNLARRCNLGRARAIFTSSISLCFFVIRLLSFDCAAL